MTETLAPTAGNPHLARPHTHAAALRAVEEATAALHERAVKIRQCPELHHPPGRRRHIQDCVDQIPAKVGASPTTPEAS
jgi:hypothetical protein